MAERGWDFINVPMILDERGWRSWRNVLTLLSVLKVTFTVCRTVEQNSEIFNFCEGKVTTFYRVRLGGGRGVPLNFIDSVAFLWFSLIFLRFLCFFIDFHWISLICMYVTLSFFDCLAIHHPYAFLYSFLWNLPFWELPWEWASLPEVRASGSWRQVTGLCFFRLAGWPISLSLSFSSTELGAWSGVPRHGHGHGP